MNDRLDRAGKAAVSELERQSEAGKPGPYIDCDSPERAIIDGRGIDLVKVIEAALNANDGEQLASGGSGTSVGGG